MKKVLEPFAQADYSTTRRYGGTGLGLSIIKSIIELMNGLLVVESTPGVGSKFSFDLKFKTMEVPEERCGVNGDLDGEEVERPMFEGEVLVCEDNSMNQEVVLRHLERVGLRVQIADNGKTGVDMVKSRRERGERQFDMIFMDINMPVMDGLEASAKIMEMGTGIPIVAMTANVMSSDREIYDVSGMHDCVGKPFTSQELWRCLLRYIKPIGTSGGGGAAAHYDESLLKELRMIFVQDNQNKFGEFVSALNSGDVKLAHRLVHTLKSNAGAVGRPALQKAAAEAEKLLVDNKNLLTKEHINAIDRELAVALRELSQILGVDAAAPRDGLTLPAAESKAPSVTIAFADELEALLRKGSPDCLKFIDAMRALPGTGALIRQMEDFDFDDALETFITLRNNTERDDG
jgi:CheY-like chemotaxis protein